MRPGLLIVLAGIPSAAKLDHEAQDFLADGEQSGPGRGQGGVRQQPLRRNPFQRGLGRVKVGQKAFVTSDSFPGKRYEGRVGFIASEAEFTPKTVQTRKERVKLVYRIKVDVPNPEMELKPGMPADGDIAVE